MNNLTSVTGLKLYHYESCPYCAVTRDVIDRTGLYIEKRDIHLNAEYEEELLVGGGKTQVPALRIDQLDGETEWLYESQDIIGYLNTYVGHLSIAA